MTNNLTIDQWRRSSSLWGAVLALMLAVGLGSLPAWAAEQSCPAGQRWLDHPLLLNGGLCIPEAPQRIAFIDDNVVYGLELGVPSITRSYYSNVIVTDFPGLAPRLDPASTTDVANTWELNGEVLAAAQPDLVVTAKYWDAAIPLAQAVAPTIIIDDERAATWQDLPRMVAAVFGKQDQQAALASGLEQRLLQLRKDVAASGGQSFTFTQVESATSLWTFTTAAFGPEFAVDAGLTLGTSVPTPEEAAKLPGASNVAIPVSVENLGFIDADHIFLYANIGTDPAALLKDSPVFQRFAAERPGRIHFLTGEYWFRGSFSSAHRIIDDIYRDVLATDPATVSPNPLAWTYQTAAD